MMLSRVMQWISMNSLAHGHNIHYAVIFSVTVKFISIWSPQCIYGMAPTLLTTTNCRIC